VQGIRLPGRGGARIRSGAGGGSGGRTRDGPLLLAGTSSTGQVLLMATAPGLIALPAHQGAARWLPAS